MRRVLERVVKGVLVVAMLLAPVAISSTVMTGEVWAIGQSKCKTWAQKGTAEGKEHGTEDGKKGAGENYRSEMDFSNFGDDIRQDIEECYMYAGGYEFKGQSYIGYEPAYDAAYERAFALEWEDEDGDEEGDGEDLIDDVNGSGSDGDEDEDPDHGPGVDGSGGGGSTNKPSGGNSGGGKDDTPYVPGEGSGQGDTTTNILPSNWGIDDILRFIVNVLMYGLGAAAVIGTVIAGIQYLTARDSEQQVAAAKKRLLNVVIGLVAWAMLFTLLNWLIPGPVDLEGTGGKNEDQSYVHTEQIEVGGTGHDEVIC